MRNKKWFRVHAMATPRHLKVEIYGDIDPWVSGCNCVDLNRQLKAAGEVDEIHLHLNSAGGDVFEGIGIFNMLVAHPAKVVAHIDSVAASIAGYISQAGDEVEISENAYFHIHSPWNHVTGTAEDMRAEADRLESLRNTLVSGYLRHSDLMAEDIQSMMSGETWFTAQEALEKGFVTSVASIPAPKARISMHHLEGIPQAVLHRYGTIEELKPRAEAQPPADSVPNLVHICGSCGHYFTGEPACLIGSGNCIPYAGNPLASVARSSAEIAAVMADPQEAARVAAQHRAAMLSSS